MGWMVYSLMVKPQIIRKYVFSLLFAQAPLCMIRQKNCCALQKPLFAHTKFNYNTCNKSNA